MNRVCVNVSSPSLIAETTGGLAPHSRRHVGYLTGRAKGRGAVDRTRYGTTRISTKSYFTPHRTQQIAKAAVMYDARAILKRVNVLKQTCLRVGVSVAAGTLSEAIRACGGAFLREA